MTIQGYQKLIREYATLKQANTLTAAQTKRLDKVAADIKKINKSLANSPVPAVRDMVAHVIATL